MLHPYPVKQDGFAGGASDQALCSALVGFVQVLTERQSAFQGELLGKDYLPFGDWLCLATVSEHIFQLVLGELGCSARKFAFYSVC